ncbi:AAA family ATPase [Paenibacillus sp. MBLB4367]|uniref:AAA family ATPase n=1 Tax=Paenibacillus sp. MBLB4367 TaxID=3384767 RepID=UPI003907FC68
MSERTRKINPIKQMTKGRFAAIKLAASPNKQLSLYEDYAYVIQEIQMLLSVKYGKEFQMYASDDGNEEYWTMLEQDIRTNDGEVEVVMRIFDQVESRAFAYDTEGGEAGHRIFPSVRNNVFAYPAWGVALARVPVFRNHGIFAEDFVFAVDDEALLRFLSFSRERLREQDRRSVTIYTDSRHGIETELVPMTRMVEREEVIMNADLKKEIFRSIDQFFTEDRGFFQTYGIPYKRGILLYGKPGNGKTTLVKSIAGSVKAPVAYWQITEYTCSESIQEVFQSAVKKAPMILVIEDIDSMPVQVRSYFLNMLDGATSKEGIFLIGTTNYPEKIDPALMNRAGRFDRAYEIKLPTAELRLAYLERKKLQDLLEDGGLRDAVKMTDGFTFAQLNELYVSAALEWHEERRVGLAAIVRNMKTEHDKGRTHQWLKEASEPRVGFLSAELG